MSKNMGFSDKQLQQMGAVFAAVAPKVLRREIAKKALERRTSGRQRRIKQAELVMMPIQRLHYQLRVCVRHADDELHACVCPWCNKKEAWLCGKGKPNGPATDVHCRLCRRRFGAKELLQSAGGYRDDELQVNLHND